MLLASSLESIGIYAKNEPSPASSLGKESRNCGCAKTKENTPPALPPQRFHPGNDEDVTRNGQHYKNQQKYQPYLKPGLPPPDAIQKQPKLADWQAAASGPPKKTRASGLIFHF